MNVANLFAMTTGEQHTATKLVNLFYSLTGFV